MSLSVPVCPHAGGVGMCELVQHLSFFDYIVVSGSLENRFETEINHYCSKNVLMSTYFNLKGILKGVPLVTELISLCLQ